jgi:hypothetical protein
VKQAVAVWIGPDVQRDGGLLGRQKPLIILVQGVLHVQPAARLAVTQTDRHGPAGEGLASCDLVPDPADSAIVPEHRLDAHAIGNRPIEQIRELLRELAGLGLEVSPDQRRGWPSTPVERGSTGSGRGGPAPEVPRR